MSDSAEAVLRPSNHNPSKMTTESRRRRRPNSKPEVVNSRNHMSVDFVYGKTPGGSGATFGQRRVLYLDGHSVFVVPTTHDVLTSLFHPLYPKSHLDILNLSLLALQLAIFCLLSRTNSRAFFTVYFIFWRAAYNAGLGWLLTMQSKRKWIVRQVLHRGWMDETKRPHLRNWIKLQLQGKMGADYSFDDLPLEYNTWLLFRQVVDVILLNDFLSYCLFAFTCFRVPENISVSVHFVRWGGGLMLIAFNLWVKTEAHRIVKDYGWYWGDVFFQRGALVFDGVFEMAPHPMYSVGYAGYYGLSLISGSYAVLFISLAAHAAQFAFLILFENPHINRTYGQRKPLPGRVPPAQTSAYRKGLLRSPSNRPSRPPVVGAVTEQATFDDSTRREQFHPLIEAALGTTPFSEASTGATTGHDILKRYFRKDAVGLFNIDIFRASDVQLVLVLFYSILAVLIKSPSPSTTQGLHLVHSTLWRAIHTFGLGLLLRAQSRSKFMVRHFVEHYFYPEPDGGKAAVQDAFANWKSLYNLSLCMTYVSFVGLAWSTYSVSPDWVAGDQLLRHVLGAMLIGLHFWTAGQSYNVLGAFGWFFGDFFIEDYPATLDYTGIYRFLNNPERTTSGAALYGLALISGSRLAFLVAVVSQLSHWWFLSHVENPHMRKVYGDSLRQDAGFTKIMKTVAVRNARILETRAGRHAPELRRVARGVKGKLDKVMVETAEVVEDFLAKSRPVISEVVQDTKLLLQQSRERFVITRLASDMSDCDPAEYNIVVVPSNRLAKLSFAFGEPIRVAWKAPLRHSRKDWIGLYRKGANSSLFVTKTSSMGMWVPIHDDEWDGDQPVSAGEGIHDCVSPSCVSGEVTFDKERLPWQVGEYEIRYHHDGKYNVLDIAGPLTVHVSRPYQLDFDSVRSWLLDVVVLCLDSDPSLLPYSAGGTCNHIDSSNTDAPDDIRFWTERQARRVSTAIREAYGIDYASEVIVADANISSLTRRILSSIRLLNAS